MTFSPLFNFTMGFHNQKVNFIAIDSNPEDLL